jgi:hypothetical protein
LFNFISAWFIIFVLGGRFFFFGDEGHNDELGAVFAVDADLVEVVAKNLAAKKNKTKSL